MVSNCSLSFEYQKQCSEQYYKKDNPNNVVIDKHVDLERKKKKKKKKKDKLLGMNSFLDLFITSTNAKLFDDWLKEPCLWKNGKKKEKKKFTKYGKLHKKETDEKM